MQTLTDDQRYAAITARDARFDGVFVTCVRTTGIFCRPSCPARTPGRDRVEFLGSGAAAVAAGYRACKRCGPLAPPGSDDADPGGSLVHRALALIEAGALDPGAPTAGAADPDSPPPDDGRPPRVADLAARLHVTERTLHRALVARTGAGAVSHARMQRARRAHQLLRTTDLPLTDIALAAGFGSERQLHDTVRTVFGVAPSTLRPRGGGAGSPGRIVSERVTPDPGTTVTVRADLAVRRPFDGAGLATWFGLHVLPGCEEVDGTRWTRAVDLPYGPGVITVDLGTPSGPLPLVARLTDLRDMGAAVALTRRMLDLDADPVGIDRGLARAVPGLVPLLTERPGVRLPGSPGLPEALLWAVVGQQITTVQARGLLTAATDLLGRPLPPALATPAVHRLPADPVTAARRAEDWFRGPGARRRTLPTALTADLDADAPVPELRAALLELRGVGPWTADYALLRGVRAIDVAPAGDVALLDSARRIGLADDHPGLTAALAAASPWRSYATMLLWHHRLARPAPVRSPRPRAGGGQSAGGRSAGGRSASGPAVA